LGDLRLVAGCDFGSRVAPLVFRRLRALRSRGPRSPRSRVLQKPLLACSVRSPGQFRVAAPLGLMTVRLRPGSGKRPMRGRGARAVNSL